MKKILFVIESLACGGAEKSLVTLLQNLNYSELKVDLILIKKGGEFEKLVPNEVTIIYKNIFENSSKLSFFSNRIQFWLLKKLDIKNLLNSAQHFWKSFGKKIQNHTTNYDIAIGYSQGFATYFIVEKVNATQKFTWLNTDYLKVGFNINYDYPFYKKINSIVAVSPESKQSITNALNSINKSVPIEIIKDISDVKIINQISNENSGFLLVQNEINLLTVCRLAKEKGLYLAIEACEILVKINKNIKWFIIGEGDERNSLQVIINQKKLQNNFILMGFNENPYPFVKSCTVYVQTSLFEGLGLTVIEASILNKPIVTTNFSTASTIIKHNETGLICEMNAKSIAENIQFYIDNDDFKNKVIANLKKQSNNDKEVSLSKFNALIS